MKIYVSYTSSIYIIGVGAYNFLNMLKSGEGKGMLFDSNIEKTENLHSKEKGMLFVSNKWENLYFQRRTMLVNKNTWINYILNLVNTAM